jgi:poly(A) polymerase
LPDLRAGRVRFIGDARQRLREDHLRGLRLFRFHAVYGQPGQLDPEAYAAAVADRDGLAGLARERVRQELLKLVVAPGAGLALEAMAEGRLLDAVLLCTANLPAFHQVVLLEQAVRLAPDASRRLLALCGLRAGIGTLAEALRLTRAEVRRLRAVHRIGAMPGWPELPGEPPLSPDDAVRHAVLVHGQETVLDALLLLRPTPQRRLLAQLSLAAGFSPPRRPYDGALMLALGLEPGPAMAKALAALDRAWIAAGLPLQPETIHQLAASVCRRGDGSDTEAGTDDSRPS